MENFMTPIRARDSKGKLGNIVMFVPTGNHMVLAVMLYDDGAFASLVLDSIKRVKDE